MLEHLTDPEKWNEFLEYKLEGGLLSPTEEKALCGYIAQKSYLPLAEKLAAGEYAFGIPTKKSINKLGTSKKRVVYTFSEDENMLLKHLSYLLYRYDDALSPGCYAFRRNIGAKRAFTDIAKRTDITTMYCFKTDISDFFNSIDVDILLSVLSSVITEDEKLLSFLSLMLKDGRSVFEGEIIAEHRGAMAGTPTSPFFANLYLKEMDEYFYSAAAVYARYSDDIIIFDKKEKLEEHIFMYRNFLEKYRLSANTKKEATIPPGEKWSFLGFSFDQGKVDISDVTVKKLFGKIRRAARGLRRWKVKAGASNERALGAFNRKFNRKFYSYSSGRELCWARWFFPVINTTDSLKTIDRYMQEAQRYIVTGKHNKAGYEKAPYALLKQCGYRPLVSAYYDKGEEQ